MTRIELTDPAPDDPVVALGPVEALRDEVEARDAHNGASRPNRPLAEAVPADRDTLLADADSEPAGVAALRPLAPGVAEIRRMYVVPERRARSRSSSGAPAGAESLVREVPARVHITPLIVRSLRHA